MTLSEFIKELQELEAEGHGSKTVLGCDSKSGAYGILSSPFVNDVFGDMGPFDVLEGWPYIEIAVGH